MADLLSKYLYRDIVLECHDMDATLMSSAIVVALSQYSSLHLHEFLLRHKFLMSLHKLRKYLMSFVSTMKAMSQHCSWPVS